MLIHLKILGHAGDLEVVHELGKAHAPDLILHAKSVPKDQILQLIFRRRIAIIPVRRVITLHKCIDVNDLLRVKAPVCLHLVLDDAKADDVFYGRLKQILKDL